MSQTSHIGQPVSRLDGPAKVTGTAPYAAEFAVPGLLYGVVVTSPIAAGRITRIHAGEVRQLPGVVQVFSHENRGPLPDDDASYRDELAPTGAPFRPFYAADIKFSMQPVALVVAETFEQARYAAAVLRIDYDRQPHHTDLSAPRQPAAAPQGNIGNYKPLPPPTGQPAAAWARAPHRMAATYGNPTQHHNPMEPFAATVEWLAPNRLTVYDKTQGAFNARNYLCAVFGLDKADVRVVSKFTGGGFGVALRPNYHVFLATLAALRLGRSVRVVLTRGQMFGLGYRPATRQQVQLATHPDGSLASLRHDVLQASSRFEEYAEGSARWSAVLYKCANVGLTHRLARLDVMTPTSMRAPGAANGVFALEVALDEMAYEAGLDPIELRLRSYADHSGLDGKPFSSKSLRACYEQGAARFGWAGRPAAPRSLRRGNQLVGWGMAGGVWEAQQAPTTSARVTLTAAGQLSVFSGINGDIGTGTVTVMTQVAAETLGLPLAAVAFRQGDTTLPDAPLQGGSWTAASLGTAVQRACQVLGDKLLALAQQLPDSPLAGATGPDVEFAEGQLRLRQNPAQSVALSAILPAHRLAQLTAEATTTPDTERQKPYAFNVHNAVFVEVEVDEDLGTVRVTRVVEAVAAGRILNPKTARSQIVGAIVWGISTALMEETVMDHQLGRFMNHSLAEYHVPVNADIPDLDVLFVAEEDTVVNPLGAKGVGEIGLLGVASAVCNAVYHATGKRIRELPITCDKLL